MNRYIIYCTPKQTKIALELGAPIEIEDTRDRYSFLPQYSDSTGCRSKKFEDAYKDCYCDETSAYLIPTAEELIGWLEAECGVIDFNAGRDMDFTKDDDFDFIDTYCYSVSFEDKHKCTGSEFSTKKEATIAAINAALEYLIRIKEDKK